MLDKYSEELIKKLANRESWPQLYSKDKLLVLNEIADKASPMTCKRKNLKR